MLRPRLDRRPCSRAVIGERNAGSAKGLLGEGSLSCKVSIPHDHCYIHRFNPAEVSLPW